MAIKSIWMQLITNKILRFVFFSLNNYILYNLFLFVGDEIERFNF